MSGFHPEKIVVPIDFSDFSQAAMDQAVELAGEQTVIHAVHVLVPLSVMEPGVLYGEITDQSRAEHVEKFFRDRFSGPKYAKVTPHVVVGDPGHEIADYAERVGADLIVMPSHGHGFFKHVLLGSVAERVVRLAHCPVLVLKPEKK
jgi:nucleotide-binding universal stress UspA family protein